MMSRSPSRQMEKRVSESFLEYLELAGRKATMRRAELKTIYENEYSYQYDTEDKKFKDILRYMCYHMNTCQEVLGTVVFGGGEEAVLAMFPDDEDDEDDDADWLEERRYYIFACDTCRRPMHDRQGLLQHQGSIRHRQQVILQAFRNMIQRNQRDLTKDKKGIEVTSVPNGSATGAIETIVQLQTERNIMLTVRNNGYRMVNLKDITLLWSTSSFDYKEIRQIPADKSLLPPGAEAVFAVGCKRQNEYGFSYVPAVLRFQEGVEEFYILRFLCVRYVSDTYDEIKQISDYVGPKKHQAVPSKIETLPGLRLPDLKKDGLKMERLDDYYIDQELRAQFRAHGAKGMRHMRLPSPLREKLDQPLTFSNYQEKFSTLVQIEELQMEKDIRTYDMEDVTMTKLREDKGLYTLVVPGLAENRPSVLRGDRLYAYEKGCRGQRYEGYVHRVEQLNVKLGFNESMPFINGKKFDIQFTFNRLTVKMEHRSYENLDQNPTLRYVLFPELHTICLCGENGVSVRSLYERKLNEEQRTAVENITNGTSRPAPYLIFGPPGTGKTSTFVEAIKQVHQNISNSVILACAPENSAADLITERLLPHIEKRKLLRMYASSRPWEFIPEKIKEARVMNFDHLTKEVSYPSISEMKRNYRIIVTTMVTAGKLVSGNCGRDHFSHIFIDEAGHAVEPECLIPIAGLLEPMKGQLVLAGDPKQLGPILRSPISQKYGLGMSLLERLMERQVYKRSTATGKYNNKVMTKLVNNYRSHKDIIEIPKKLFYDDELNECADEFRNIILGWEELPNRLFPIIVHPVFGEDQREERSPSFFNVSEVETIEKYLKKLLDDRVRSKRMKMIQPEMIGIVSPYKRQVQKIQEMIKKKRYGDIKVGSVEEFQGQERRVVIVSTVRSKTEEFLAMDKTFSLGFLDNPKRFNVVITRAQALLIFIGNTEMLKIDDNWKRFLEFCDEKGGTVKVSAKNNDTGIESLLKRMHLKEETDLIEEETDISMKELQENPEWTRHE